METDGGNPKLKSNYLEFLVYEFFLCKHAANYSVRHPLKHFAYLFFAIFRYKISLKF